MIIVCFFSFNQWNSQKITSSSLLWCLKNNCCAILSLNSLFTCSFSSDSEIKKQINRFNLSANCFAVWSLDLINLSGACSNPAAIVSNKVLVSNISNKVSESSLTVFVSKGWSFSTFRVLGVVRF